MSGRKRGQARPAPFSLLSLPTELQAAVFTHIDSLQDALRLGSTCRCALAAALLPPQRGRRSAFHGPP